MYTLRDFTKTPADIGKTLGRVKKVGYDAVQLSALGPIDPKELAKILQNEGLTCCATHVGLDRMRDQTQQVIEDQKLWGCKYTAIGGFFKKDTTFQDWMSFAEQYNTIARKFDGSGIAIGYHNHSHELVKYDGRTVLEMLIEKLSPKVWFEIDTYWIQHGGGDPIQWIKKVKDRIPCVHLKDMAITPDRVQIMAEIGEGNLNWDGILPACRDAKVEWYIIEQDECNGKDPFQCVATSLRNARAMGLK